MPSPDDLPGPPRDTVPGAPGTAVDTRSNGHADAPGRGSNGHGPSPDPGPESPRRPPGPSTKPALVVLGITLVLCLVGVGLEVLSGSQSRPTASPTRIATAKGAVLHAVPARPLLKDIVAGGQPPDDLLNALAVPRGATPVSSSAVDQGVETYDRSLRFELRAPEQAVISFFRAELPALHWRRLSQGPTGTGDTQYLVLEQHPASDGLEWDLGVTVSPTDFGSPTSAGTTAFTLRLYAVSDQD
ncbi:MAG TPA: hypothetical protein VII76_00535 [Acidimicrobiales bacterium]